jgi:hypothetical protein
VQKYSLGRPVTEAIVVDKLYLKRHESLIGQRKLRLEQSFTDLTLKKLLI